MGLQEKCMRDETMGENNTQKHCKQNSMSHSGKSFDDRLVDDVSEGSMNL